MTVEIDIKALLESGAHFGHKTSRWHPKMAPYIHSKRQGGHIINLEKTVESLEKALPEISKISLVAKKSCLLVPKNSSRTSPKLQPNLSICLTLLYVGLVVL